VSDGPALLLYQGVNFTGKPRLFGVGWGWSKVMGFPVHTLVVPANKVRTVNGINEKEVLARVAIALRVPRFIQFSWHV
jgi:hypothetical protein